MNANNMTREQALDLWHGYTHAYWIPPKPVSISDALVARAVLINEDGDWFQQDDADLMKEAAERVEQIENAAKALLDDVLRRHPGEDLRCPLMIALDEAVKAAS